MPYPIPAGASDHPLGGHGFAGWAFEVEDQEAQLGFAFDNIVVCSVTGSTQAGMVAGFAHNDRSRDVLGIDASATVEQTREQILRIARRTAQMIELGRDLDDDEVVLMDRWHDGVYGIASEHTLERRRDPGVSPVIRRTTSPTRWPQVFVWYTWRLPGVNQGAVTASASVIRSRCRRSSLESSARMAGTPARWQSA